MGESPLVASVSSGRILATISPIRNAVELAGLGSYLKRRARANWIVEMRVGEPRWMGVPPLAHQRCQPFLSIGSTATSNKQEVRQTISPRSAAWLDLRIMIHNSLPDCPPSSMGRPSCQTITAVFRRHPALASALRTTTDPIQAPITLAVRTFHQSRRYLSMGR